MTEFAFDTHRAVKTLQSAGFDDSQAEAVVDAIGLANGERDAFASKSDLDAAEERLDQRIDGVEERLNERIDGVEERLNERIDGVEERLNERIDGVEGQIRDSETRLNERISTMERTLKSQFELGMSNIKLSIIVWLYAGLVGAVALIETLDKLL